MVNHKKMPSFTEYFKTSDDLSIRYGIWVCDHEPKGSVLLLNGRAEFMEKYSESIKILNERGYEVFSLDWRGQGMSNRILPNRHKGYVESFDDYVRDLDEMFLNVIRSRAITPLIVLAHSMGGHVAVRFVHDFPDRVSRLILTAPMIDIHLGVLPKPVVLLLVRLMMLAGRSPSYVLGNGDYRLEEQKFKGNALTSDPTRFLDHVNAIRQNPDLALGGVTYGWLSAAFDSIKLLGSPGYVEKIDTPTLIAVAQKDQIVSVEAQKKICSRMPYSEIAVIKNARHEILKESDGVQKEFWDVFDRFLG